MFVRQAGVLMTACLLFFLPSCVPVEEKTEVPFNSSLSNELVRHIYDLQSEQDRDSLVFFLRHEDPSARYAAAKAFASFQDSSVLDELVLLLGDPHNEVRAMAAQAIGLLGSGKAEARLTSAFDGRDSARLYEKANGAILEAMGRVGTKEYLRALSTISTYQKIDTLLLLGQTRGIYRYALRGMTDPEGTATMLRYLSNKDIPFRARLVAANYLHRAQDLDLTSYEEVLVSLWHSEQDPNIRMCLATALGKLKTTKAKDTLLQSLATESDYRVKCNILRALQSYFPDEIHTVMLEYAKSGNAAMAEVAAQFLVSQGRERDASDYRAAIQECKTWQGKTRLAEAANKYMTSMFSAAKTSLHNEIQSGLQNAQNVYEKAAWLRALGAELRNFESLPKYATPENPAVIRTQAVQSLIDATKDKNFNTFFAGEGHLIRSQIGGYLANTMRQRDAGILALIAGAITDPKTGLKEVMKDRKDDLVAALSELNLPAETETYLEITKALQEYEVNAPPIPVEKKAYKTIDWAIHDKLTASSKAVISTTQGDITLVFYPERAPASVINFIELSEDGYYTGKLFHRVVPNFVIQDGCPRGDGYGSLDFTIRSELADAYYDEEGYIGMASAGPHTEGTQFFITHSPAPHLDGRYTIFGKVTSGMDVIHKIEMGDTIKNITVVY